MGLFLGCAVWAFFLGALGWAFSVRAKKEGAKSVAKDFAISVARKAMWLGPVFGAIFLIRWYQLTHSMPR